MELRLRDHLAKLFNEQKKSKKDVRENARAMAKLLKEAQRLKTVLSANAEHMAQVRGHLMFPTSCAQAFGVLCLAGNISSCQEIQMYCKFLQAP